MTQPTKVKPVQARKNIVIDPTQSMPVKRFMDLYKARDYAGAQAVEKEMTKFDLERSNIL